MTPPAAAAGGAVFIAAFLYRLPDAASLVNDHFMHVAWGRQLLWGRLPIRDAVSLGMPLQTALSAAAERVVGYRLLSEGLLVSAAFAAAAVCTFVIARRATGRPWLALGITALSVALAPRTYSYPKVLVYAAGILVLWRYIDRPSTRRAVELALAAAVAFYLRHDHGLYLGAAAAAVIAMRHGRAVRATVRQTAVFAAACALLVAPYAAYVQAFGSVAEYARDLRQFSEREHAHNPFVWPSWPLSSPARVARWTTPDDRAVPVAVRWSAAASDDARRRAAARHRLAVPADGTIKSGWFPLADTSAANALALVNDPAVEDTAGIDRVTGDVRVPGLYLGPVRVLDGLDGADASAALLFFVFLAVMALTAAALARRRAPGPLGDHERIKIAAVLVVAGLTFAGFVRESLSARIPDAVVAPAVLGAWLSAAWLAGPRRPPARIARIAVLAVVLAVVTRSVVVAGGVRARVDPAEPYAAIWRQVAASPPFDAWPAGGSARYRVVDYVRACTRPDDPLLVLWFAPELYYYADRPFGGRLGAYMAGYYTSDYNQRLNAAALDRDRPAVAVLEAGRELTELASHQPVLEHLAAHYDQLGSLPAADGTTLRVFGRSDRRATSRHQGLGWPCYR